MVLELLLKVPEALEDEAVKVTLTPETGLLFWVTVTASWFENAALTSAVCGLTPASSVIRVARTGKEQYAVVALIRHIEIAVRIRRTNGSNIHCGSACTRCSGRK